MKVDPSAITVEDGDGIIIRWNGQDSEIIRLLGIDTPEVRRLEHNLPYDQPFRAGGAGVRPGSLRRGNRRRTPPLAHARPLRPNAGLCVHQRPELLRPRDQGGLHDRDGQPLRRQRPAPRGGRDPGRREVRAAVAVRASPPVPHPDAHPHREPQEPGHSTPRTEGPNSFVFSVLSQLLAVPAITRAGRRRRCRSSDSKANASGWCRPIGPYTWRTPCTWLNDPEITAMLKHGLGVTRRQEELFFERMETQRDRDFSGRSSTNRSGTSASSGCTRSTGAIDGPPAASSSASGLPGARVMRPTPSASAPGSPSASWGCTGSRDTR